MDGVSRREALLTMAMAGGSCLVRGADSAYAAASQPRTKIGFAVPAGACDTHVHVFCDPQRYPMSPGRGYTPEPASVSELEKMLAALHMDRVVVVHPSVYGTDNRCMLDSVRQLGKRARGVAVIDADTPERELDEMARVGVRGIRVNLTQAGVSDPTVALSGFRHAVDRAKPRNWFVELNTAPDVIDVLHEQLQASPVPIVIDHFGGAQASLGVNQPGFSALVDLVKAGTAYVKLSAAADQISTKAPAYPDVVPLAKALVAANPQRVLWGTDWPHPDSRRLPNRKNTDIAPLFQTDDGLVLNLLPAWVPDASVRQLILVDNPVRLFGF